MSRCILHVTDHEYDKILQLNHDRVAWSNHNRMLLRGLEQILSRNVMHDLCQYDECRMERHHRLYGIERIEEDETVRAGATTHR